MGNNQSNGIPPLTNEEIAEFVKTTHFDDNEVRKLHNRFKVIAQSQIRDGVVDIGEFQQALGLESRGFAQHLFKAFDKDSSLTLEFREFIHCLSSMSPKATLNEKGKFIFNVYDKNNSGDISKEEFREILQFSLGENRSVHLTPDQIDQAVKTTFDKFDKDNSNGITLDEFIKAINSNPAIVNCVSLNYSVLME